MEYENLDASGLNDSYSRPSYVMGDAGGGGGGGGVWRGGGGGGGGGQRLHRKVQKEDGEFTEKFVVSIENI